jgi:UDP-N-acetylglucosamine--N-acetylmuramyl-(pentapeptide) pyrophosphoryl-undecaprenol N-acetylglucosamine transferase
MISLGGTGGHIYPALALSSDLSKEVDISFIGGSLSTNRFFSKEDLNYTSISCSSLSSKNPLKLIRSAFLLLKGVFQSIKTFRQKKPDLIVGFGSYYTLPPLIGAAFMRIPIILHEANSVPGRVNRLIAPFAKVTALHFPTTPILGKKEVVQMPIRFKENNSQETRENTLKELGLETQKLTLLIFGGSQGASKLNDLIALVIPKLNKELYQVIHLTGKEEETLKLKTIYEKAGVLSLVKTFDERMDLFLSVADLAITRAGASTIAELIAFKVPSILIPYPFATEAHQEKNALFVSDVLQGAITREEDSLKPDEFAQMIDDIFDTASHIIMKFNLEKVEPPSLTLSELIKRELSCFTS